MLSLDNHFIGTYAKNFLADWVVIRDLMHECTRWVRETVEIQEAQDTPVLGRELLSDQKINDALNGPFQAFFKLHLNGYATIAKLETAMTLAKEDFIKDAEELPENEITLGLPNYLIERSDFSTLKEVRNQLNTLVKEHFSVWQTQNTQWQAMLIAELKVQDLSLTDLELQDFSVNQPVSELQDRFTNLNVTLPKLPKSAFDFSQYWTLKITLAIHSILSRTHLPNTDKEIEERLKILRSVFKKIHETEKGLLEPQQAALAKLLAPVRPKA